MERYLSEKISEAELTEFFVLVDREKDLMGNAITELLKEESFAGLSKPEREAILFNRIIERSRELKLARVVSIRWWRIAAAAIILIVFGSYFLFFNKNSEKNEIVKTNPSIDIPAPVGNKAMITLADGRMVTVDSLSSLRQGDVEIVRSADGKIEYKVPRSHSLTQDDNRISYNTMTNPRGSKVIDMALSDGSHVWLNAGSSITYPVAFVGKERKVSMTGEAYFEISHNASKPFKVGKGEMEVTVLGTHFNVNAYDDENEIKVTLLEGKVAVKTTSNYKLQTTNLLPGQQALLTNTGVSLNKNVNLEQTMAWKNGIFDFDVDDLPGILRQISRWYDAEIIYEGTPPSKTVTGQISRDVKVSNVLKMLELTGKVGFRIENNKVIVFTK